MAATGKESVGPEGPPTRAATRAGKRALRRRRFR
ncbi:DUF6053 domain-containing protein [Lysobacter enzymogenes]